MTTLIACSHGTNDRAGQDAVRRLIDEARALAPEVKIVTAVVDVEQPQIGEVVAREVAEDEVIVVPLLLSVGHHTAVDIAQAVQIHANARQAGPIGTHPLIADVLVDRLLAALPEGWLGGDHVVLAAAGSTNPEASADVELVAARLRTLIPVPVTVGYASASTPRIRDAVATARQLGAVRVIVASHVLAPGFFAGLIARAGADIVSRPLAPDMRIAQVIVDRYRSAR